MHEIYDLTDVSDLIDAVKEWQDARKAVFAHPMKPAADAEQLAVWARLGSAEHALMKFEGSSAAGQSSG